MAVPKTSLSAGAIIRAVLLEDPEVSARTNKVFPVATDSAELPYILYRRSSLAARPQKSGQPGADEIQIEVICFTERYGEGVELAEAVRGGTRPCERRAQRHVSAVMLSLGERGGLSG